MARGGELSTARLRGTAVFSKAPWLMHFTNDVSAVTRFEDAFLDIPLQLTASTVQKRLQIIGATYRYFCSKKDSIRVFPDCN